MTEDSDPVPADATAGALPTPPPAAAVLARGHLHPAILLLRLLDALRQTALPLVLGVAVNRWFLVLAIVLFVVHLGYSLARYPADSPLSMEGEELRKQTNENPVFYVQYAHARTSNVHRLAVEDGVRPEDGFDPSLLTDPTEAALLAILGDFPRVVAQAAKLREPHRVARYELVGTNLEFILVN